MSERVEGAGAAGVEFPETDQKQRCGYGQFYPAPPYGPAYLLFDGPDEWGLRIDRDGTVTLGAAAKVAGDHPNYEISLPSGMTALVDQSSRVFIENSGSSLIGAVPEGLNLAEALRDLVCRPEGER